MGEFIAVSESSKNALNMANLASTLPVQVLIFGEVGTGKTSLANIVAPQATQYDALQLQLLIKENNINLDEIETLIVPNIHHVNNVKQFIEKFDQHNIKLIATATEEKDSFQEKFAVRIDLPPLCERLEDLKKLSQIYLDEANRLFETEVSLDNVEMDTSLNSISLKRSIYRSVLFDSINKEQVFGLLEKFLYKEMADSTEYKDLLEIFEIPLIKVSRTRFKSQLQMAQKLGINRNTLRKKINQYNLQED
ncbi:MAG: sigma 54-interacting transcriptional regulator [Epsilonproteobacteria bacterium]|nr:sigma 54-interacting transcriptional regulator [Campylobacterota bacterium]